MKPEIIVVGTSLGGLHALESVLAGLDKGFPLPIAVVQHRGKSQREMLAALLQKHTELTVKEAEDKDSLMAGHVYIAPADYHLLVERGYCGLSLEPPLHYARPSVDVLFESAAWTYGAGVIAVVLTGNNADGAHGSECIKKNGGIVIVQDPGTCEKSAMPLATMAKVQADYVLKLPEIAPCLIDCCQSLEEDPNGCR